MLQILGKDGELVGIVRYTAAAHRPLQPIQAAMQQLQQHKAGLSAAQSGHDSVSTDRSIPAVTKQAVKSGRQHRQFAKQPVEATTAAGTMSLASQDSMALSAFGGGAIPAGWQGGAEQQPAVYLSQSRETADSSHDEHSDSDADSLIPSGTGVTQTCLPAPACCSRSMCVC